MLTGEHFYKFMMTSDEGIRIVDELGIIIEANEAYCQLIGLQKTQIIGDNIARFETYLEFDNFSERLNHIVESGDAIYTTRLTDCNNNIKRLEVREMYFPGNEAFILGVVKNIASLKDIDLDNNKISDNEKIKAILSTIPYPIFAKDKDLKYIECNKAFEYYIGKSREEIIGFDIFDIFDNDVAQIYQNADLSLLNSESLQIYETVLKYNDGVMHEVIFHKNVIRNSNNDVVGIVGVVEDISERKAGEKRISRFIEELNELNIQLAENKAWFKMISDYSNNWEVFRDKENKITYCSPSIEKLLGYKVDEYINEVAFTDYVYPEDFDFAYSEYKRLLSGESPNPVIFRLIRKSGEVIWVETSGQPIYDNNNEFIGFRTSTSDISKLKNTEFALRKSEAELKDANSTKDKFFSIIAHDLKNPLGSFRMVCELLISEYDTMAEAEKKEFLLLLKDSATGVYSLLENLLEWSRSQRGIIQFNPEYSALKPMVDNVFDTCRQLARNKNIELNSLVGEDINVFADKNMFVTIIRNLLTNAIKFTHDNGAILVSAKYDEPNKATILEIIDNGVGMSPDTIEKIFKIDKTLTTVGTNHEKGSGLGLILCKEFIEKHGGKIHLESALNVGTKFVLSFPLPE